MTEISESDINRLQNMFSPEELHSDLVPFVTKNAYGMPMIHHRLVINIPYSEALNRIINLQYKQKKLAVQREYESRNWASYVFIHERPYRFDVFCEIKDKITLEKEFWDLVGSIWTDSENICENFDEWHELWSEPLPGREAVMDEKERNLLNAMPDSFQIWRGAGHPLPEAGLSWTRDRQKAIWFARRHHESTRHKDAHLASGIVKKKHVLGYFTGRNEREIVVLPENVINVKVSRIR